MIMPIETVSATKFARNVANYLDQVRYSGNTLAITKGSRVVAELAPPKPTGFSVSELANLIANAPKLGHTAATLSEDIKTIRDSSKKTLDNPWE
jgi:antitoxin (DNA-binding transcriptional repressor) of toxin-antitoxin stability system